MDLSFLVCEIEIDPSPGFCTHTVIKAEANPDRVSSNPGSAAQIQLIQVLALEP